jgi:hypothetical protein
MIGNKILRFVVVLNNNNHYVIALPIYDDGRAFNVWLDDEFFGMLTRTTTGWYCSLDRAQEIIDQIGNYLTDHYN